MSDGKELTKNTEQKFSSLSEFRNLRAFPDTKPLILINLDLKIEYANKSFLGTFHLKEGDSVAQLETDPEIVVILKNIIDKKYSSFHFDLFMRNSSEGFFIEIERILIGEKNYFVITFSSVAERKQLEEKINNLHYALEYGFLPVITLTTEGKLNYSTDSFERLLGKNIQQLYGKHVFEFLSEFLDDKNKTELSEAIEKQTQWKTVVTFERKEGRYFYELVLNPIHYHHGKVKGFVLSANDVTDHILRLRTIEKNEKRQRLILNSISEPLVIIRKTGKDFIFENANEVFYKTFNINAKYVIESDFMEFPDENLTDSILTAIDRLLYEKKDSLRVKFSHKKLKKDFTCKLGVFKSNYDASETFVISFFDITQQLENEKRLRAAYEKEMRLSKLKSAFMANMSHEIRTPLNAIIGYADLLDFEIQEQGDEALTELTNYLKDGARRLVKLVENIIDVSRIESGEFELSYKTVDIREIFEKLRNEFKETLKLKNVTLIYKFEENATTIETDPLTFEKLFWELLDNAIKYNIDNGKIFVHAYSVGDSLRIEVEDTGRGISDEMMNEVLKPFTQDDLEGYTRRYEGAGLGLTFAYKVTKLMGGKFHIESELNKGTKLVITLPKKQKKS